MIRIEGLSFTYTANGKRQIQVKNFSTQKIHMDKILRETTYLCVEMLNSRLQAKEKLSHVVQSWSCGKLF